MKKSLLAALAMVLSLNAFAGAQLKDLPDEEVLEFPTYALILTDGEQLVIRGEYVVQGNLTYFYYDHGSHPTYASLPTRVIDFEKTDAANEKLDRERQRKANYFLLIEERRRKILEEAEQSPSLVRAEDSGFTVEDDTQAAEQEGGSSLNAQFPPYTEQMVTDRPQSWWQGEAARLFGALEQCNAAIRDIGKKHDDLVIRINRAGTQEEADRLQREIETLRIQMGEERERARFIGNRLVEFSEAAEVLGIPLAWIIPDGSTVFDAAAAQQPRPIVSEEPYEEQLPAATTEEYSAPELRNVPDTWWARERKRLEDQKALSEVTLRQLRSRYNTLVTERKNAESDIQRNHLTNQMDEVVADIKKEEETVKRMTDSLESLFRAARELGKEQAVGLLGKNP